MKLLGKKFLFNLDYDQWDGGGFGALQPIIPKELSSNNTEDFNYLLLLPKLNHPPQLEKLLSTFQIQLPIALDQLSLGVYNSVKASRSRDKSMEGAEMD